MIKTSLQIVLAVAGILLFVFGPRISKFMNRRRDKYKGYATTGKLGLGDDNPTYTPWTIRFYGIVIIAGAAAWHHYG